MVLYARHLEDFRKVAALAGFQCFIIVVVVTVLEVIFQKRVRVFHQGFRHEKTDESKRPQAECFYCFRVFETPMKQEARVFEITSPTKEISLKYHLNKFSQFNYYI